MPSTSKKSKIVVLGDIHFPYHNKKALREAIKYIKLEKPTHVVQIGDLYDQYSFSRFSRKNITLPIKELNKARKEAVRMWQEVGAGKQLKGYQILGNHDIRLNKRVQDKLPEAQELIQYALAPFYTFEGVTTIFDDRKELIIDNIVFIHGYRSRLGDHAKFNRRNTVVGHSHVGGAVFEQYKGEIIWELNAGYLADETAEPMRYRPQLTSRWTLGWAIIDEHGPRFIPYD